MKATAGIWLGAAAALLLGGGAARADRTLTLDEALALARAHNRDLRVGRARLAQSEAGIAQARAALLPTVAAQGRYTHNYKEVALDLAAFTGMTGMPPIIIQKGEQLDGSLTASVPLIAPAAWSGYAAAKATARAGEANYAVTEVGVLAGVAEAYFAAAGTDEVVVARQHAVTVADQTYAFAKARVGSDLANPVDVTRAETALVRAQQDLVEAQNTRAAAYRALATLLGTHEDFAAVPSPSAATPATGDVAHALAARPELAAERATLDAADQTARAAAYRWAPTLSAFGNAHLQNYAGFSGDKYSWAVGVQLDWALYDGGARDAQRHLADAQAAEAEARLELLHDTVSDDVANALGTLDTKRKAVDSAQRAVTLANEALRMTRAQYEAGTAQQLDVLQAQDSVVSAEVGLAQAHFAVSLADVELRRATGSMQ